MNEIISYHLSLAEAKELRLQFKGENYAEFIADARRGAVTVNGNKFALDFSSTDTQPQATGVQVLISLREFIKEHLTDDEQLIDWVLAHSNQCDTFGALWTNYLTMFADDNLGLMMDAQKSQYNFYQQGEILYYETEMHFGSATVGIDNTLQHIQRSDKGSVAIYRAQIKIEKKEQRIYATLIKDELTNYHDELKLHFKKFQQVISARNSQNPDPRATVSSADLSILVVTPDKERRRSQRILAKKPKSKKDLLVTFMQDITSNINDFVQSSNAQINDDWKRGQRRLSMLFSSSALTEGSLVITNISKDIVKLRNEINNPKFNAADYQKMGNNLYEMLITYKNTYLPNPTTTNGRKLLQVLTQLIIKWNPEFAVDRKSTHAPTSSTSTSFL